MRESSSGNPPALPAPPRAVRPSALRHEIPVALNTLHVNEQVVPRHGRTPGAVAAHQKHHGTHPAAPHGELALPRPAAPAAPPVSPEREPRPMRVGGRPLLGVRPRPPRAAREDPPARPAPRLGDRLCHRRPPSARRARSQQCVPVAPLQHPQHHIPRQHPRRIALPIHHPSNCRSPDGVVDGGGRGGRLQHARRPRRGRQHCRRAKTAATMTCQPKPRVKTWREA